MYIFLLYQMEMKSILMITSLVLQLARGIWFIEPASANAFKPVVEAILTGKNIDYSALLPKSERKYFQIFHSTDLGNENVTDIKTPPVGSIAVTPLSGVIMKNDFCGELGTKTLTSWMQQADKNQNIAGHLIVSDSPGGSSDAMFEMSEAVKRLNKPVVTFVDGMMASAAYGIGSASKHIMASHDMNNIGSIGTYTTIMDFRKADEMAGIKEIVVYATESTEKNKDYLEALEGNLKPLQQRVDEYNDAFLSLVKRNRFGKNLNEAKTLKGQIMFTQDALKFGLIDSVGTFDDAIQKVQSFLK